MTFYIHPWGDTPERTEAVSTGAYEHETPEDQVVRLAGLYPDFIYYTDDVKGDLRLPKPRPLRHKVGDRLRVRARFGGLDARFTPHTQVTLTEVKRDTSFEGNLAVKIQADDGKSYGSFISINHLELIPAEEATMTTDTRPTIDFSDTDRDRSQARKYAADLDSRVLKPENRAALQAVARGERVDAYALNAAVTEALSSCSTRAGQSMARREMTRKGRHLGHIVQAVLENHADNLPGMEPGVRSRKIETLEGEIAALQAAGESALAQVEPLVARVEEEKQARESLVAIHRSRLKNLANERDEVRERLLAVDREREILDERVTEVVAEKTYAETKLSDAEVKIAALTSAFEYAQKFLSETEYAEIVGYAEGQKDARKA